MGIKREVIKRCHGISTKIYSFLRFFILPIDKIDKIVPKKGKIIDYGCGFGTNSCYLALSSKQRKVVGLEYIKKRVERATIMGNNIKNLKFKVGDISKIGIEKADVHLLIDVIHHVQYEEQVKLLNKIIKTMKKGNLIVIKDIDKKPFLKYIWNYLHDKIMTFNNSLYFRNQQWFEEFLKKEKLKTKIIKCESLLYSHFIIIGKK